MIETQTTIDMPVAGHEPKLHIGVDPVSLDLIDLHKTELDHHEAEVSVAAAEVLNGLSTPSEREEFMSATEHYSTALQTHVEDVVRGVLENGGSGTDVNIALVNTLLGSKTDIVSDSLFQHAQDSRIEQMRSSIGENRISRFAGKIAIGAILGATTYLAVKGIDTALDGSESIAGPDSVAGVLVAIKGPAVLKGIVGASSDHAKKSGIGGFDKHDYKDLKTIMEEVADIPVPEEREKEKHRLITERFHIRDLKKDLWELAGPVDLALEPGKIEDMVSKGVESLIASLNSFYEVETKSGKKAGELVKDVALKFTKAAVGKNLSGKTLAGGVSGSAG